VPAEVVDALRPPRSATALDRLERHFAVELLLTESVCPSVRLGRAMWELGVMPRWSGHGGIRPWDSSERAPGFAGMPRPPRHRRRVVNQLAKAVQWRRYLRTLLG
jgi:hypothetical protein